MSLSVEISDNGDDISDEKIEELLRNAQNRVNGRAVAATPDQNSHRDPRLRHGAIAKPYISIHRGVAHFDSSRLSNDKERALAGSVRVVEDPIQLTERASKDKKATAGSDWFNLPQTNLTPELKRDLQLLKMRNVLDPKRHYKKDTGKSKLPEFSQVGTIIEGPMEYYSSRIPNKERKKTFVDEVLATEDSSKRFKAKYNDIQAAKTSGKKAYYKKLKDKRSGGVLKR